MCSVKEDVFRSRSPSVNGAEAGDWSNTVGRKWEMMDKSRLGSLRGIWLAGGGRGLRKTGDAWTPDFWESGTDRVDVLLPTCTVSATERVVDCSHSANRLWPVWTPARAIDARLR